MPYSAGIWSTDGRLSISRLSARGLLRNYFAVTLTCVTVACCLRGSRAALLVELLLVASRLKALVRDITRGRAAGRLCRQSR